MSRLRVLITNNTLATRAGSELYVRDLATGLRDRGHAPIAYSRVLGDVAEELRRATVPVVDDLGAVGEPPDIIHGQHHLETMTALLHFPRVPAIYVCHGWGPWEEAPPRFPRIRRYVAVDETCRDRLVFEHGIPEAHTRVVLNFVDLERFPPRGPLPARPARALVFSNYATAGTLPPVQEACHRVGIALDVVGLGSGTNSPAPEAILGHYDLVFAKGRSALEALAVGTAVIVADSAGLGGMVTTADLGRLRRLNFGIRTLRRPVSADSVTAEILRYDGTDATEVSRVIRSTAGRDAALDELLDLYRQVVAESPVEVPGAESRAAGAYLSWLSPTLKATDAARARLVAELDRLGGELDALRSQTQRSAAECVQLARERERLARECEHLQADRDRAAAELAALLGTATFRMRSRLLRSTVLAAGVRAAGKMVRGGARREVTG